MINNEETLADTVFLVVIIARSKKDAALSALCCSGVHFTNTVYCKGTFKSDILQSALGLVPEKNKVMITTATTSNKASAILEMLNKKFNFENLDTGIAFTIPVNKIAF